MGDADINALTMKQYLALTHGNQAPDVVKPEIRGNVNFEIKSQFTRELREDTFLGNKNDDAYEHVEMILGIIGLFNILGVTHDAVMLRVFPMELQRDGWTSYLQEQSTLGICSRMSSFNGIVRHLKWQSSLRKFITSRKKVKRYCTKHGRDSQGPIPNKIPAQALDAIQTMADHSQKWYDASPSRRVTNDSSGGIVAITIKLDSLGRDMKKLKENVHAIQVGCKNYGGAHLNKECMLHEELKNVEEVKYGDFSDEEETEEVEEIEEVAAQHEPTHQKVTPSNLTVVSYYVAPYEPPIPFPRCLEQHAEEALVHKPMESLKRIKVNHQLLKDIRKIDDHAKHMKNLVLALKEQDPGSFTLLFSIGKPTFNALADLGASISIMPLLMFKRLVDYVILDMVEDLRMHIILGKPLLATTHANEIEASEEPNRERDIDLSSVIKFKEHWCKAILQQKGDGHKFWASCNPYDDLCDGETNTSIEEDCEELENFREEKMELKLDTVLDKLDYGWLSRTVKDEEVLDGIVDYLDIKSHDGFIGIDEEAYKERCVNCSA
ncbi:hypothetical protein Tco_1331149 [Tanacetum coccineum]